MWIAGPAVLGVALLVLSASLPLGVAYLTYTDASVRSSDHPVFWGVIGLFVPLVGTLGYRVVRPRLGEPTDAVPRRARWLSVWVRVLAAGLALLATAFAAWVVFLSSITFGPGALRSTLAAAVGFGLVYWLVPSWSTDAVRPSGSDDPDRDGPELSWWGRAALGVWAVVGACVSLWAVQLYDILDGAVLQLFLGGCCVLAFASVLGAAYRPYNSRAFPGLRPADARHRSAYGERCRAVGCPVSGVWVADDLRGTDEPVEVVGLLPGYRHLVLDEEFFETFDDRERLAAVTHQASLADSYHWLYAKAYVYVAILGYYGLVAAAVELTGTPSPFPDWPLVPTVLLIALLALGARAGRRKVYRADRCAADWTSAATVVGALESLDATRTDSRRERVKTWLSSTFGTRPSPRMRIGRLREEQ